MNRTKLFVACALAFAVSLAGTAASAQEPTNQITYFTFSAPFELPGGKTLPAGKYVFKILDSPGTRHVVQVMSEDQQTMHATVLAIPAQRMEPSDEPEIRFMEAEANMAPAVRTWWYPGRTIGHEFIYPKAQARRLAARQTEGVLTTAGDAEGEEAMRSSELTRLSANGEQAAENSTNAQNTQNNQNNQNNQTAAAGQPATAGQTAGQTGTAAQSTSAQSTSAQPNAAETRAASASAQTAQSTASAPASGSESAQTAAPAQAREAATTAAARRTELPRTASPLPLIGLLGLASLLGAGALRMRR